MPRFRYILEDPTGQQQHGELEALNEQAAREELTAHGPMKVVELLSVESDETTGKMSRRDSERLATHLSELTSSGIPVEEGLRVLGKEVRHSSIWGSGKTEKQLNSLAALLESGKSLDQAIQTGGASPDLVSVIQAGIRSGNPGRALTQYVTYIKSFSHLRAKVTFSFIYPAMMFAVTAALFIFLMVYIVPDFTEMFGGFGIELPATTRLLIIVSNLFANNGASLLNGLVCFLVLMLVSLFAVPRLIRRRIQLRLPLFGRILQAVSMARLSHALGFLIENEVPTPEAVLLAGKSSGDPVIVHATELWAERLELGETLREAIGDLPGMHAELLQAVQWGQDSQFLSKALHALGTMYEARARIESGRIIALVEPIITLVAGLTIGYTVIALFAPLIYLMNDLS